MLARAGVSAAAACAAVGRVRGADQPLLCWASLPEPAPQASTMPLRSTALLDGCVQRRSRPRTPSQNPGCFPHYLWQA